MLAVGAAQSVVAAVALLLAPLPVFTRLPGTEPLGAESDARSYAGEPLPAAIPIPPPDRSRAVFGYLGPEERFDAYVFIMPVTAEEGITVSVPLESGGEAMPALAILDARGERIAWSAEAGAAPDDHVYDAISLEKLRPTGPARVRFESGETYYVRVEPGPDGYRGPYVVNLAGTGRVSATEGLSATAKVPRIWLGLYGQSPLRLDGLARLSLGAGLCFASLLHAHRMRHPRRRVAARGR
ncbi:MAG: hypothetical protein IBX62_06695 [Coriobacteriia bacterium]|nr:hypothetical protein [Coriobacteriia bacterium]